MIGVKNEALDLQIPAKANDDYGPHKPTVNVTARKEVERLCIKTGVLTSEVNRCDVTALNGSSHSKPPQRPSPRRQLGFERENSTPEEAVSQKMYVANGASVICETAVTVSETVSSSYEIKTFITDGLADNRHNESKGRVGDNDNETKPDNEDSQVKSNGFDGSETETLGLQTKDENLQKEAGHEDPKLGPGSDSGQSQRTADFPCNGDLQAVNSQTQSYGRCPAARVTRSIFSQYPSFELYPDREHSPWWLDADGQDHHTRSTSPGIFQRLIIRPCRQVLSRLRSTVFHPPTPVKPVLVQLPSGPVPFGSNLNGSQAENGKWFHYLRTTNQGNGYSLASQLDIQDRDEVLMINGEIVVYVDPDQVLLKFKRILNSPTLDLVIRRQTVSQDLQEHYVFIHITTEIRVKEKNIEAEEVQQVKCGNKFTRLASYPRTISHEGLQLCFQSDHFRVSENGGRSAMFTWTVFCEDLEFYCVFKHKSTGRYLTVVDRKCMLERRVNPGLPVQVHDNRVFHVTEPDSRGTFLESANYNDYYLAWVNEGTCEHDTSEHLCLHHTEDPTTATDYVLWTLKQQS